MNFQQNLQTLVQLLEGIVIADYLHARPWPALCGEAPEAGVGSSWSVTPILCAMWQQVLCRNNTPSGAGMIIRVTLLYGLNTQISFQWGWIVYLHSLSSVWLWEDMLKQFYLTNNSEDDCMGHPLLVWDYNYWLGKSAFAEVQAHVSMYSNNKRFMKSMYIWLSSVKKFGTLAN